MSFFKKILKQKPKNIADTNKVLEKLNYESGTEFTRNKTNKVYVDIEELGGFPYLKTVILGEIYTNIKRTGCTLSFVFKEDFITLNSDNTTVESDLIKNTKVYFTPIDFELTEDEAEKIKSNTVLEIIYTFKDKEYKFKI